MAQAHPIIRELLRQSEQGFVEAKSGLIVPSNLHFEIKLEERLAEVTGPLLSIWRGNRSAPEGVIYRQDSRKLPSVDSMWLATRPEEDYIPFRNMIDSVAAVIGRNGKSTYCTFRGGMGDQSKTPDRGWPENEIATSDLGFAMKQFRYGQFKYSSDSGAELRVRLLLAGENWMDQYLIGTLAQVMQDLPYSNSRKSPRAKALPKV